MALLRVGAGVQEVVFQSWFDEWSVRIIAGILKGDADGVHHRVVIFFYLVQWENKGTA